MDDEFRNEVRSIWSRLQQLTDNINANRNYSDSKITDYDKAATKLVGDEALKVAGILQRETNTQNKLDTINAKIEDLSKTIEGLTKRFVTKEEFFPVKAVVFTLMSLMGIGVVTALLRLILPHADFTG